MDKRKLSNWEFKQKRLQKEDYLKPKKTSLEIFFLKPHREMEDENPIIQDQEAESESSVQTIHFGNESKSTIWSV